MEDLQVILLVEDNESDELLAVRALKLTGMPIQVEVARDGVQALAYLADPAKPCPDFVLLDLRLPKVSGLEVLKSIRANEKTRYLPVVVFTSSNQQSDVVSTSEFGANSLVRKPVDFDDYLSKLSKLADYWLNLNEPWERIFLAPDDPERRRA